MLSERKRAKFDGHAVPRAERVACATRRQRRLLGGLGIRHSRRRRQRRLSPHSIILVNAHFGSELCSLLRDGDLSLCCSDTGPGYAQGVADGGDYDVSIVNAHCVFIHISTEDDKCLVRI